MNMERPLFIELQCFSGGRQGEMSWINIDHIKKITFIEEGQGSLVFFGSGEDDVIQVEGTPEEIINKINGVIVGV